MSGDPEDAYRDGYDAGWDDGTAAARRELHAELEAVKTERDLAVLTLAAFTPANKPLPTLKDKP